MGGTAPYTGTGTFTEVAGTYTYTVSDANGCTAVTTITVTEPALLVASVSTSPSSNPACSGTSVTFTAFPTNGGLTPSYQWYKNGLPVGGDSPTYSLVPLNGDQVYVQMTSSESCITGSIANSSVVAMTVFNTPAINNPGAQTAYISYTLPAITGTNLVSPHYYNNSQALGGTQITGPITSTQTVWIYDQTATSP
ncbi:MAG: hypothetical protein IPH88_05900, partial [Bacteroidales bacterium]|nr:hypothetical protein [Bacteroidales bacterium]